MAAVAGLVAALAAPIGATGAPKVNHEAYTMTGVIADAMWFADGGEEPPEQAQEPAVGTPRVVRIMGADATSVYRVPGQRPERMSQPPLIAMGLMMPGVNPGDEPYGAELWCIPEEYTFTVARDLSTAGLEVPSCVAEVVVFDEETGEESPNGVTVTIDVTAEWSATGPAETQKSHSRYVFGSSWTMDISRSTMRPASADIVVTGLPGGTFDETASEARIEDTRFATLMHQ
jgi:hypothetical protein